MFQKNRNYFDNQTDPTLDLVVKFFKLMLFWIPSRTQTQSVVYHAALIFTSALLLNQLIYVTVTRKIEMFMSLLQYSTYHVGVVKVATYHIWRKQWQVVIVELSNIEIYFEQDLECRKVLKKYKKRGHRLVFCFVLIAFIAKFAFDLNTYFSVVLEIIYDVPIPMRSKVLHIWWPFSEEAMAGWTANMVFQIIYGCIGCTYVIAYDSLLVLVMVVFAGQMQLVAMMFRHSLKSGTLEEQKKKLIKCHQTYIRILK